MTTSLTLSDLGGPDGAEVLVLGHSLGTSAQLWAKAVPLLASSFRLLAWELPGHGQAPAATGTFTLQELSDGLIAHLDELGIDAFHHAGVSIGGCLSLDLALRHSERVRSATVVSAGAKVDAPAFWNERAALVRAEGTQAIVEGSRARWFAPDTSAETASATLDILGATDDESYALAAEALAAFDVSERLAEIAAPIMAVAGAFDAAVPMERSADIAAGVPAGSLVVIEGAAHSIPVEQPAAIVEAISTFAAAH